MFDFTSLPFEFWLSVMLLAGVTGWGWFNRDKGWGLPVISVCFTVLVWYHGDAIYNDYIQTYEKDFPPKVLNQAWMQIDLFVVAFAAFVSFLPDWANAKYRGTPSIVEALRSGRLSLGLIQPNIETLAVTLAYVWLLLFGLALWRTDWNVLGLLAPYLGEMAYPWARGQIAASWFDSLAVVFGNIAVVCSALFGVCAAALRSGGIQSLMLVLIAITWPSFFMDRIRNVMLIVMLPGLLTLVFFRWRGRLLLQAVILIGVFIGTNFWFKFIIANRSQTNIVSAVTDKLERDTTAGEDVKHLGLNMYEELCWINYLIEQGTYNPPWGELYLANLVNPIPRALWPGKPTMGLDYAIARGQIGDSSSGVTATIATGLVGSGVVNFGRALGPIAAALIMSLWCAFLARLDLKGADFGSLLVYMIGIVGTFNFGRDISLLGAYPTLFGFALLWGWRHVSPRPHIIQNQTVVDNQRPKRQRGRRKPRDFRSFPDRMP